jgi:hypothetical protein
MRSGWLILKPQLKALKLNLESALPWLATTEQNLIL